MNKVKYVNPQALSNQRELPDAANKFQDHVSDTRPSPVETIMKMMDIIDTNHMTHELNELDWEMLEYTAPDIPMGDISDSASKYFSKLVKKGWNNRINNHE